MCTEFIFKCKSIDHFQVADQGDNITRINNVNSQQGDEIISLETNLDQINSTVLQLEVTENNHQIP